MIRNLAFIFVVMLSFSSIASTGVSTMNAQSAMDFFNKMNKDNVATVVDEFYDKNTDFQDPIHKIKGSTAVTNYYQGLYKNVETIRFEFTSTVSQGNTHILMWTMHLKTPSLNGGKEYAVDGNSVITYGGSEGKVIYHRDYFDMGDFVYERVPVLKNIIGYIKARMSGS